MASSRRTRPERNGAEQLSIELPAAALALQVEYIAHHLLEPDPEQPRDDPDAELRDSIRREGILQPLTVRPRGDGRFVIVDGERRWKGAAGVQDPVPCVVREDQGDEFRRLVTQLVANTGKPLSPTEEARAFARAVELSGKTVTEIAELTGRPRSTIGDRLALLEVGAWMALVEQGEIPVSYVVRCIVPLRGVPDECHRIAIDRIRKDYRWEGKGTISLRDFERLVDVEYGRFMYPLLKSSKGYGKNPEFDTRPHDKECACGTIMFTLDYGTKRKCCGNPDWWRPRHRKALAAKPKKRALGRIGVGSKVEYYVPREASVVDDSGYGELRKGLTPLTARHDGRWTAREEFDPTAVPIDPAQLVLVRHRYGNPIVATKDQAAITTAKEAWATRWRDRRHGLVRALGLRLKDHAKAHRVSGPGVGALLQEVIGAYGASIIDVGEALGHALPDITVQSGFRAGALDDSKIAAWLKQRDESERAAIATGLAYLIDSGTTAPHAKVQKEIQEERARIGRKPVPWLKKPKAEKPGTGKPGKAAKKAKASRRRAEDEEETPAPARCATCGEADCGGDCADDLWDTADDAAAELEPASA